MKSLIVGMGIGNLYKEVLTNLGHEIVTVDLDPSKAMYTTVEDAIAEHEYFDTVHICTPNFTHEPIARAVAPFAKIVFVEKPGFKDSAAWLQITKDFPYTRFMMVKNNQWRDNIEELRNLATKSYLVELKWNNKNRVPNPGTWFTTKELAFGGVSRDLMTHLLSLFQALNVSYANATLEEAEAEQEFTLAEVSDTDYGIVNPNGTYDVDDFCNFGFTEPVKDHYREWQLNACWRNETEDDRGINFHIDGEPTVRFELGLCPAEAYQAMIADAVKNIDNDAWWQLQLQYDLWIHAKVETL